MRRGEIRLVDLDPARGAEADNRRPAVIVSNDAANTTAADLGRGVLTVVPVTSNVRRVYPFQVLLPAGASGLSQDSKAQAEQVRAATLKPERYDQLTDAQDGQLRVGPQQPVDLVLEPDRGLTPAGARRSAADPLLRTAERPCRGLDPCAG